MRRGAGCDMQYSYKRRGSSSEEEPPKRQRVNDSDLLNKLREATRRINDLSQELAERCETVRELKA